ncbi:hypothetical protein [Pontibacter ummariensis]|uniref:hypothetical protein n=1 Tax=Pontibacter ummariensis TaxID=1610492 RepID=UPI001184FB9A|nr:hypothetical protein [Pontibacter ummariensis]
MIDVMKRRFLGIATATMMLAGGSFFAFAGNGQLEDCPLKGTPECPLVKECKLKGTPDCPLVKDEAKKGKVAETTTAVAVVATNTTTAAVPTCCKKK